MKKQLLLGAEAIALAAIDAGISGVYAYPGTPSTEITEFIQKSSIAKQNGVRSRWSVNEKTAYEAALGMSYAGKRSLVCMKHVGLNVAADPFMCSASTGIHGGLVVVVADDPSMHSSQNEQDTRAYGRFAYLPVIEPSNQQEAYESLRYAFDLSEQVKLPILFRITTRLSHSRAVVQQQPAREQNALDLSQDKRKWILIPSNARPNYAKLLALQPRLTDLSETSTLNRIVEGTGSRAVIAFGIAYNYVMEVMYAEKLNLPVFKISQYPLPEQKIRAFVEQYDDILIAEEGYPIYEELLKGFFGNHKFRGRLDGALPRMGELSPDAVAKALGVAHQALKVIPEVVASRPPMLCQGCGHIDLYEAMNKVFESYPEKHVFSDIGCYALGALSPYDAISTCVDMGASVTMAKGASDAGFHPAVAVIGDSTFIHSGITGLLDAVNDKVAITVVISDNSVIAMTGGQETSAADSIYNICKGLGVDESHIRIIEPLKKHQQQNIAILKEEFEYQGVSVILAQRECVQMAGQLKKPNPKI